MCWKNDEETKKAIACSGPVALPGPTEEKKDTTEGGYINRTLLKEKFGSKNNTDPGCKKITGLFPVSPLIIEDLPDGNIKLDFNTTLENIFGMAYVSAFCTIALTAFLVLYSGWEKWGLYLFLSLIALFISIIFHVSTDNYYFVDMQKKALIYHFQFLWIKMDFQQILISDIKDISIDSRERRNRYDRVLFREYSIVFLTGNGRKIKISDWRNEEYMEFFQIATELARKLNIESIQR